jgi:hypothetical protein
VLCEQLQVPFGDLELSGVASLRNLIFVGCSTGQVLVFEMHFGEGDPKDINVLLRERLTEHQQTITHIHSLVDTIVDSQGESNQIHRLSVADAFGNVSVWHLDGPNLNLIVTFNGFNK